MPFLYPKNLNKNLQMRFLYPKNLNKNLQMPSLDGTLDCVHFNGIFSPSPPPSALGEEMKTITSCQMKVKR